MGQRSYGSLSSNPGWVFTEPLCWYPDQWTLWQWPQPTYTFAQTCLHGSLWKVWMKVVHWGIVLWCISLDPRSSACRQMSTSGSLFRSVLYLGIKWMDCLGHLDCTMSFGFALPVQVGLLLGQVYGQKNRKCKGVCMHKCHCLSPPKKKAIAPILLCNNLKHLMFIYM